jgi:hypothetical protein
MLQNVLASVDGEESAIAAAGDLDLIDSESPVPSIGSTAQVASNAVETIPEAISLTITDPVASRPNDVQAVSTLTIPERYRDIYSLILARREWPKAELVNLLRARGLMLNATLEAINEWSVDVLGDWLLEEAKDGIIVHCELAENC